jgi:hypothetical protein
MKHYTPATFYDFVRCESYRRHWGDISKESEGLAYCPYYDGIKETAHSYMMFGANVGE